MRYKNKLMLLGLLILVAAISLWLLGSSTSAVSIYSAYVFIPFQHLRNLIFSTVSFSAGDLFYIIAGILLTVQVFRMFRFLLKARRYKEKLIGNLLNTLIVCTVVYLWFLAGWAGNYYKAPLGDKWKLDRTRWSLDTTLALFDSFLVDRLNSCVRGYKELSFHDVDNRAWSYFKIYTTVDRGLQGIKAKPTFFAPLMYRMGVQGYYNPFTGEAQATASLPAFMLPFVVCHELAHQCGIAAEDDANLLSYALCTDSEDSSFRYSAYFNVWMYAHARLIMADSTRAKQIRLRLNNTTLAHLDTLKAIRKRYESGLRDYSSSFYDGYLKMNRQKEGLRSYNKVTVTAWALEELRKKEKVMLVIP